ncbi:unnamed protein product [Rotaria sp. Silwood2]|nr:unnamed protein product [Rotaria sp. Silwood2]
MLKSDEILEKLEPDSKDVFVEGLIDMYINRPDEMKNVCLADFVSLYNISKKKTGYIEIIENSDDEDVIDNEIDEKSVALKMKNGKGWIKKRTKKKIIRYRNFKLHQDPENYYREQLMLFLPWSKEEEDLIHINHEETFELHKDLIRQNRSEYVHREANEFEKAFEEQTERGNDDDIDDTNVEYDQDKNEFLIYEIGNNEGDIFVEMGLNTRTEKVEHFNVPKIIPDTEYQEMMRSLNNNQRRYTLNVMNLIKNGDKQFFHFINGGAGVGKSTLIKAVYQSILRFYNSLPGSNPETIRTAICAPTGKAAALIGGMTLHSFLSLPVNQCKHKLVKLDSDISNRIGVKLKDLQLLIIDEISMVGFTMFQHVDANNILNRDSTNAKTQIDYCFTNVKDLKSDYFESLTSFHKPIWIRKHKVLTKFHFDETEDIHTNVPFNIEDIITDDQSDTMEVDEKFVFARVMKQSIKTNKLT